MSITKRVIIWAVLVVLVLVAAVILLRREPIPRVYVARVVRDNLSATTVGNGKVEPISPHVVRAPMDTFVEQVKAIEGQQVRRGQLLVVLQSAEVRASLARAREELLAAEEALRVARTGGEADEVAQLDADLRKAQRDVEQLRRELASLERLLATHAATREEVQQKRIALERAEAGLQVLEKRKVELQRRAPLDAERAQVRVGRLRGEIRALEEKVRDTQVTAPADGTLYSLPVREGDFIRTGELVAEMADLRRVRVRAFIDEPELAGLEVGQSAEITWDAMADRVWKGRTEGVPRQVVQRGARSVGEVLCSVENEGLHLLPNTNVNVRILIRALTNVLVIPRGAVRGEGSTRYVFRLDGNDLRRREIQVGVASATMYEVRAGLAENDFVALPGDVDLRDGMRIKPYERK